MIDKLKVKSYTHARRQNILEYTAKMSHKIITTVIILIFIILSLITFFTIDKFQNKYINLITIIGTLASLIGLIIVYIQVNTLKNQSKVTQEIAEKTRNSLLFFINALDIAKIIRLPQEIQGHNRSGKFELSIMGMHDLKYSLKQILNNPHIKLLVNEARYSKHITDLSVDINNIEKQLSKSSGSLSIEKLNGNLEAILNDLQDIDTKLKQFGG